MRVQDAGDRLQTLMAFCDKNDMHSRPIAHNPCFSQVQLGQGLGIMLINQKRATLGNGLLNTGKKQGGVVMQHDDQHSRL